MTAPHAEVSHSDRKLDQAFELLYQHHQLTLVNFARQRGCDEHEAWDSVQELFLRIFRRGLLELLCTMPVDGQRAWLMRTLNWIVLNQWRHKNALRRGDGTFTVSIDTLLEQGHEPADQSSPEIPHDRAWIMSVIERGVNRLRSSFGEVQWKRIEPALLETNDSQNSVEYTPALRVAVHRARCKLRDILRYEAEIETGSQQGKLLLFQALAGHA